MQGIGIGIETCFRWFKIRFLMTCMNVSRLCSPFFLREFLVWLEDYKDDKSEYWKGWMWGLLLSLGPFLYMITHNRLML